MANEIQLKRSSVPGKIPDAANVLVGEPVVNLADRILYTKDGTGNVILVGANLTLQVVNTANTVASSVADVRTIQFDSDSGFDVVDRANGIAKVQMNSTFKTWNVQGQANLVAQGLDVIEFVGGDHISITTDANTDPKQIIFNSLILGDDNAIKVDANGLISFSGVVSVNGANGSVILNTSNIAENGNLYFTNSRVVSALTAGQNITIDANGRINSTATGGGGGDYGDANVYANVSLLNFLTASNLVGYATNAQLTDYVLNANLTTANVVELTNLYFTNARVYSNVLEIGYATNENVSFKANISDLTTANVIELSNLYFTNARVYSNVLELNYITSSSLSGYATNAQLTDYALDVDLTTDNVTELTNLYFTNARARSALSGGNGIDYNSGTGVIAIGDGVDAEFKDLTITGNLLVLGETTTINAREIAISDNMIYLNEAISFAINNVVGDGANVTYTTIVDHGAIVGEVVRITGVNPSSYNQTSYVSIIAVTNNTITIANTTTGSYISGGNVFIKASINPDLGITGGYNDGTYHHAGVFRDASDGNWKFFEGYNPEPDANIFIDTSHVSFSLANVQAKYFVGPVIGNVSDITNHTTTELAEGSNLYFTNARVTVAISTQTLDNATFTGNVVTSANLKANAYIDASNRRLLIKDANNIIVWGN